MVFICEFGISLVMAEEACAVLGIRLTYDVVSQNIKCEIDSTIIYAAICSLSSLMPWKIRASIVPICLFIPHISF